MVDGMGEAVGLQLGNYQLTRLLGRGGFAEVYLGEHVHLGTEAAIKVLRMQLTGDELEGFRNEARLIARLQHPNIVRILDFGVEDTTPFLVMDYAPNGTLRKRYTPDMLPEPSTILPHVKQLAAALQYAHDARVIHRDIKPENMLLGRGDEVLLSDFGIAVVAQSSHSQHIQNTAGTIAYMAPEQIQARPGPASDQYALGIVVYEWLCGERPFSGTLTEVAIKHTLALPPSLQEKVPSIPLVVEQVVLKALAKDPEQRFGRIQDFALAFEEACNTELSGSLFFFSSGNLGEVGHVPTHNLPAQVTPLVGRDSEVAAVGNLLLQPEVRLLTLTGTGGVGKTRLALQVATELTDDFIDGVCFVPLASISDPELVVPTIAQTLNLKENGARQLSDLLRAFLREKHLLLLLDNFEQVVAAAPQLSGLITECPRLKVLITSRAVLHIRGEHEFPVSPLALPDLKHLPDSEALSQYAAVALFLQRARAIRPDFQLTPTNAQTIAKICIRLEGLPLAIELAAARVKLLPLHVLLARLEYRLPLLTGASRDAPTRQQTLRNTIAWSYQLLDAQEQRLFRHLSVFAGGCTLTAAEMICAASDDGELAVLDGVASLIDKSLLQQTEQEMDEPRLLMLETIREYGQECLVTSGEMEAVQQAHAAYYLDLTEQAEADFGANWLEHLEREHDNLRAALNWSLEHPKGMEAVSRIELALRASAALQRFWMIRGHVSEGRAFLARALTQSERVDGVELSARSRALKAAARLALVQGDYEQGEGLAEKSLALCRQLGDKAGIAFSLYMQGIVAWRRGKGQEARSLTEEALALFREVGDQERIAYALFQLASMASQQGDYTRGRTLSEESVALLRRVGNQRGIVQALCQLAQILLVSQTEQTRIPILLEESLALSKQLGFKEGKASSLCLSAQLAMIEDDLKTAEAQAQQSLRLYRRLEHRHGTTEALLVVGRILAAKGEYAAARAQYEESLAVARQVGDKLYIASCLEGLASVASAQGDIGWAVRLWAAAASLRGTSGAPIPPFERDAYEHALVAARRQLGESTFSAVWAEGQALTPEQAVGEQGKAPLPVTLSGSASRPPTVSLPPAGKVQVTYPDGLTTREVEVLRLVARGFTDAQVAEQLVISPRTVNAHLTSIYGKIRTTSRAGATRYAIEHKLT